MLDCWLDKSNLPEDFAAVRPDRIMTTMQALSTRSLMQALTNWQVTCICGLLSEDFTREANAPFLCSQTLTAQDSAEVSIEGIVWTKCSHGTGCHSH